MGQTHTRAVCSCKSSSILVSSEAAGMNKNHILGREEAEELGVKLSQRKQQSWGEKVVCSSNSGIVRTISKLNSPAPHQVYFDYDRDS